MSLLKIFKKSPLCGPYTYIFCSIYYLWTKIKTVFEKKSELQIPRYPSSILLCSQASLGDLFLATFLIQSLKEKYPHALIGVLTSNKAQELLYHMDGIDQIHIAPCWIKQGKIRSLLSFWYHTYFIYPKIENGIKKEKYTLSIELSPFFPNSLPIVKNAKIPIRLGIASGGFEHLMTHHCPFRSNQYLPHLYKPLLALLGISSPKWISPLRILQQQYYPITLPKSFIILHMGSSDKRKNWEPLHWHTVANALIRQGITPIFTGKGAQDHAYLQEGNLLNTGISLIDQLDFPSLAFLFTKALGVISIDSFAMHLACYLNIPCIGLFLYSEGVELWIPDSPKAHFFISNKCTRKHPYQNHPQASYLDKITPKNVLEALVKLTTA